MYQKAYGIIETLAPLHVGASAGEETGNLNLIFRDQFTQTGIIPGSSIRGRFRADMRDRAAGNEQHWYGHEAVAGQEDGGTTEAIVKFEYASIVWLPVFCPGQPIVWVTCPRLLQRYKLVTQMEANISIPEPYTAARSLHARPVESRRKVLFFNLGFLEIEHEDSLAQWIPEGTQLKEENLVVVADNDIAMIHDMALYRQSRVKLSDSEKKVEGGAFFNVEALPEGAVMVFPIALKELGWRPFGKTETADKTADDLYFGGLESIGFGHCKVILGGEY
ncbi:RAMP superfamily CRISPR-associated protein [Vacuolonema iberomarrocanum]|uniref:RAMP superfamily CRISPR-associated protein n=1 Tax=Vacuolonema iberomarrocanum TaxID=3454632 RepID=UPI0019EBF118|nr:type III-B CRISPR module RAMP protein Cmr4 [filamentous cyanobacterium LEGE 07170]